MENMEIERKFLIREMPRNLEQYEQIEMTQGYLTTDPVVRVRRENNEYMLTYKGGGMLSHSEYNLPLTEEAFDTLISKCDGIIISKSRYIIPLDNGLRAELDIFKNRLSGLAVVEVEFSSEDDAAAFIPPKWFGDDVTEDARYHNSYISRHGIDRATPPG